MENTQSIKSMTVTIIGAGAVGGMIATLLSESGHDVIIVENGTQYSAILEHGLQLKMSTEELKTGKFRIFDKVPNLKSDLVVLATKSQDIPLLAKEVPKLLHSRSMVLTVQNGIPWWYFQKHGGEFEGKSLLALDPTGSISESINPDFIIGSVFYPASKIESPGVIRHIEGIRMPIGELDSQITERAEQLAMALTQAGFKSRVIPDIRAELWLKALGSVSFNPISALTGATMREIGQLPVAKALVKDVMLEASALASALGIVMRRSIDERLAGAESVGEHKTSMLMDLENKKPLEIDGLVGVMIELAEMVDINVPYIRSIYASTQLLQQITLK